MDWVFGIDDAKRLLKRDDYAWLKYVRLADAYVFANADLCSAPDHKYMISDEQREQVVSAAYLKVRSDGMTIVGDSSTLRKYPAPDDPERLAALFGIPCEAEY